MSQTMVELTYTWRGRGATHPQNSQMAAMHGVQVTGTDRTHRYRVVGPVPSVASWLTQVTGDDPGSATAAMRTVKVLPVR